MLRFCYKIIFLIFFCAFTSLLGEAKSIIYVIPIQEEINTTSWHTVRQGLSKAKDTKADVIIFKINTYGGNLVQADSIRNAILKCGKPTFAYIDHNAASAGALIALSCNKIFMSEGASIGAATVVDEDGKVLPDKYQSYMRSIIRSTAEAQGKRNIKTANGDSSVWVRDPLIAEAMVDPKTVVPYIGDDSSRVVTLTTGEAKKYGFCDGEVSSINELVTKHLKFNNYVIEEYTPTFLDKLWGFLANPAVQAILIMIIIAGIYFELQTPGLGFPSAAAITAAILYFLPLYMEGMAQNWEIIIFASGVIALVFEIFVIPGFGFAGIAGIILILTSLLLALIDNSFFSLTRVFETDFLTAIITVIIGTILAIALILYISHKIGAKKGIMKFSSLLKEQNVNDGYIGVPSELKDLLGKTGKAETVLRPSGKIRINDEVYDAVSINNFIEQGTQIIVTKYENAQLYVKPSEQSK